MKTDNATHVAKMRKAAKIVSLILKDLVKIVQPGISLLDIDWNAESLMRDQGVTSYEKGYHPKWVKTPFPAHICTSVNNCIAHGIPTPYKLQEGDIVNIDVGIRMDDVCGDGAITVPVGKISQKDKDLLKYANRACYSAINDIHDGARIADIGEKTMQYAHLMGYEINWAFSGHGIGKEMHEKPGIPFFYDFKNEAKFLKHFSDTLKKGQVICIEPMLTTGKDTDGQLHSDGWSRLTRDGKNSAMFEHMVLITEEGFEILTDHFEEA